MNAFEIIGGIIIMVCAVIVVVTVMLMEGKSGAMNGLTGSNESSYLGKNKGKTRQATLGRIGKWSGIIFVVTTLAVYFVSAAMR